MSRRFQDLLSAVAFGALGVFFLYAGRELPIAVRQVPGPGLFPVVTGVVTVVLALFLGVSAVRGGRAPAEAGPEPGSEASLDQGPATQFEEAESAPSYLRPFLVWTAVLACALLLPVIGFLGSTLLLMLTVVLVVERRRDAASLVTIVALPLATYWLFAVLLDVRLPTAGFLG